MAPACTVCQKMWLAPLGTTPTTRASFRRHAAAASSRKPISSFRISIILTCPGGVAWLKKDKRNYIGCVLCFSFNARKVWRLIRFPYANLCAGTLASNSRDLSRLPEGWRRGGIPEDRRGRGANLRRVEVPASLCGDRIAYRAKRSMVAERL